VFFILQLGLNFCTGALSGAGLNVKNVENYFGSSRTSFFRAVTHQVMNPKPKMSKMSKIILGARGPRFFAM
jgi:hypothetical protein